MPTVRYILCGMLTLAILMVLGCTTFDRPTDAELSLDDAARMLLGATDGDSGPRKRVAERPRTWVDGELLAGIVTPWAVRGSTNELYLSDSGFMGGVSQIAGVRPGDPEYRGGRWHINRLRTGIPTSTYANATSVADLDLNDFISTDEYVHCPLLPGREGDGEHSVLRVPSRHQTIQEAVDAALDGDEVVVAPGRYCESIVVPPIAITIRSLTDDPAQTILDGSQNGDEAILMEFVGEATGRALLRGFTITKSHGRAVSVSNRSNNGNYVFENCHFIENGPFGALRVAAAEFEATDCRFVDNVGYAFGAAIIMEGSGTIHNCLFRNNDAIPFQVITLTQAGGIYCLSAGGREGSTLDVRGCTFEGNHCTDYGAAIQTTFNHRGFIIGNRFIGNSADGCAGSIYVTGPRPIVIARNLHVGEFSPRAAAIGVHFGRNTTVRNNTILYSRGGEGIRIEDAGNITVERNIVAFGASAGIRSLRSSRVLGCNNSFGNPGGNYIGTGPVGDNMSVDPRFCDAAGMNFELSGDSPCLPANNDCGELVGAFGHGCDAAVINLSRRPGHASR